MITAGVIAEYDPFHNGHAFLMRKLRQMGADRIAVIMSGNFMQRGDAAIISKWTRTKQALYGGADLVVELPLPWAVAGAERFARGGIFLLSALGADIVGFGSECGDITLLKKAQEALTSPLLHDAMRKSLNGGETFAVARQKAVNGLFGEETAQLLREPNNILGIEYLKAIKSIHSNIKPVTVKRKMVQHNMDSCAGEFASSAKIRSMIKNKHDFSAYVPNLVCKSINSETTEGYAPASLLYAERAVLSSLRRMERADFSRLPDISEGLENRIYSASRKAVSLAELFQTIKTKRYPLARIKRIVLSAFLGIKASDGAGTPPYCRVLGIGKGGADIIRNAKQKSLLPIITKHADCLHLNSNALKCLKLEARSSDLYALCTPRAAPCGLDFSSKMIVL